MACGCVDSCNCVLQAGANIVVSGAGTAGNPYIISTSLGISPTFAATNPSGGIAITPAGPQGHTPAFDLDIDPSSTAPVSVSGAGLKVDCCGSGLGSVFTQSYRYDFAELGGAVGSIALTDLSNVAQQMPAGSMILSAHADIVTPFTSAGDPLLMLGWDTLGFEGAFFNDVMSVWNTLPTGIFPLGFIIINNDIHPASVDFTLDIGGPDPLTNGVLNVYLSLGQFT